MSYLDEDPLRAPPRGVAPDPAALRSQRLHDQFEAYYAQRERRRLSEEALARRNGDPGSDGRVQLHDMRTIR